MRTIEASLAAVLSFLILVPAAYSEGAAVLAEDANNDSLISRAEWIGDAALFDRQDTNKDGAISNSEARWTNRNNDSQVTADEMSEIPERDSAGHREGWRERRDSEENSGRSAEVLAEDSNHDSLISRSEWLGDNKSFYSQDLDGDGVISNYEARWTDHNHDNKVSRNEMEWGGWRRRHSGGGPVSTVRGIAEDLNHDNVISRSEWRGNERTFYQQDTNRDGVISNDEARWVDLNHDNIVTSNEMGASQPAAAASTSAASPAFDQKSELQKLLESLLSS